MADEKVRIVIADEHEIMREGIARLFQQECNADIVGEASDGYSTIKLCRSTKPDVLVLHLGIAQLSGMETFNRIRKTLPDIRIIVSSDSGSSMEAFTVLSMGAAGFLPKQAKGAHFVAALRSVMMGYTCVSTELMSEFASLRQRISRTGNIYGLSAREIEIMEASVSGAGTKEIAERLGISVRTVETHRNAIYKKTNSHCVEQLQEVERRMVKN